jgi:hypothetical protein
MDRDMTLDPGTSRLLRDWLHETAEELPDDPALFVGIKAGLRAPRPRPWAWPLRSPSGRAVAVTLAATIAVVAVGLAFTPDLGSRLPGVGAAPSPAPSMAVLPKFEARLPAGRYRVDPRWLALGDGIAVSVEVPKGWHMQNGNLTRGTDYERRDTQVDLWAIDRIYIDPCAHDDFADRRPWDSLEWFAGSLTGWWPSSAPTSPVTTEPRFGDLGGYPGFELTASVPGDIQLDGCADQTYLLWRYADQSQRQARPGDELLIRVIAVEPAPDVPGAQPDPSRSGFLSIVASTRPETPPEAREELLGIVDSVRIERLETQASPSAGAP